MGKGDRRRPSTLEGHASYQKNVSAFATGMDDLKQGQVIKKKGYTIRKTNAGVADTYDEVQRMVREHFDSTKQHIEFGQLEGVKYIQIPMISILNFGTQKEERLLANVQLLVRRILTITKHVNFYQSSDTDFYIIRYMI